MARNKKSSKRRVQNPVHTRSNNRRRKKKGNKTLFRTLIIVILIAVGAILSLTVFFKIESIFVSGTDHYDTSDIIAASQLHVGDNLFLSPVSSVPAVLKAKFPYIEDVEVHRVLPPGVDIKLTPSIPAAALQQGDEYSLITLSGKILEKGLVLIPSDIILVKGIAFSDYEPGSYLGKYIPEEIPSDASKEVTKMIVAQNEKLKEQADTESDALAVISYLLKAIDEADFRGISNLNLSDPLNMTVMYENRLLLRLGTELELVYKLKFIKEAVASLGPDAHGVVNAENATHRSKTIYTPADGYNSDGYSLSPPLGASSILDDATIDESPEGSKDSSDMEDAP